MNQHLKCGLKILASPVMLAYYVAASIPAMILGTMFAVSGCYPSKGEWFSDPIEDGFKIVYWPVNWLRNL